MKHLKKLITLLLAHPETSASAIARMVPTSYNTASHYRHMVTQTGWTLPQIQSLDSKTVRRLVYVQRMTPTRRPDWDQVCADMERWGWNVFTAWEAYRAIDPDTAMSYAQFARRLRAHRIARYRQGGLVNVRSVP